MQPTSIAYHQALPTVDVAKENYNVITSDHAPLIATIPLSAKSALRILSSNVHESDSFNGLSPLGHNPINLGILSKSALQNRIQT